MNKKRFFILFIVLTIIAISSAIYARYIINKSIDMTFSTVPFYFYAEVEADRVLMLEQDTNVNLTVKNYIKTFINQQDINYEISLEGNDKFYIDTTIDPRIIFGSDANEDELNIPIHTDVNHIYLNTREDVTLVVTSTGPYRKRIEIPIMIFTNENMGVYNVIYKVDVNGEMLIEEDGVEYKGISLDSIFGADRPYLIYNNSYSFNVTIPGGYTATVERNGNDITNRTYPLGTDPVYVFRNNRVEVDTDSGPASLVLSDTFFNNNINEDVVIVVVLNKKSTKPPVFNATLWLQTENARSRGATGTDVPNGNYPNLLNESDGWDWASFATELKTMEGNETDGYSITWTFQTNSGSSGYILDSFELNGVNVIVPFFPAEVIGSPIFPEQTSVGKGGEGSIGTATLPDGAKVELELIRVFKWRLNDTQRVYQLRITGAYSNITVTGGNLQQGTGAAEVVVYNLVGLNTVEQNGETNWQSDIIIGSDNKHFRFKLLDHYENPVIKFSSISGKELASITANVEDDGYYHIYLPGVSQADRIGLLEIIAKPIYYAIEYDLGEVEDVYFATDLIDNNKGKYYTIENSRIITVSDITPIDASLTTFKKFSVWTVGENEEEINVGQILTLDEAYQYATVNENGIHVIKLKAKWIDF